MVLSGSSPSAVARIYGDSQRAIAYWVKRFEMNGLSGLSEESRPGRPPRLNARQARKVQAFVEQQARKDNPVNGATLSDFLLTEFNISMTHRQCWRILKRLKT